MQAAADKELHASEATHLQVCKEALWVPDHGRWHRACRATWCSGATLLSATAAAAAGRSCARQAPQALQHRLCRAASTIASTKQQQASRRTVLEQTSFCAHARKPRTTSGYTVRLAQQQLSHYFKMQLGRQHRVALQLAGDCTTRDTRGRWRLYYT